MDEKIGLELITGRLASARLSDESAIAAGITRGTAIIIDDRRGSARIPRQPGQRTA